MGRTKRKGGDVANKAKDILGRDEAGSWMMAIYMWPKKGGFFKRVIQPAIVEFVDGTRMELIPRPMADMAAVLAAVRRLNRYYFKELDPKHRQDDGVPLVNKRGLPARFTAKPGPASDRGALPVDITVTPWEAKLLGDRLLAFARAEKAAPPCETCMTKGRVMDGYAKSKPCDDCDGTGWLKPPRRGASS